MIRTMILATGLAVAALSGPAIAQGKAGCPPGLAKKSVPCVPPGQAKKGIADPYDRLRVGDRYDHDRYRYDRIRDYDRWNLPPIGRNEGYYRDGHVVYRVDEETRRVLAMMRLAQIILGE